MELSIIIVNYNSRLLLEQCYASIKKAAGEIQHEIIVVDNNSVDGSKELRLAEVKFIFNDTNAGFAKACNQGFKVSSGNYILFLNPDTILPETALKDCLSFFEANQDAGAVGVRMIDSGGRFLKESKRGLPTPSASFFKLFGLASIFPGSRAFASYYQGHLSENENHPVEVLSGAFMMIRREAFEKAKGFDEDFFMYAEDIDLSVRLKQLGYQNYYLGKVNILHLKGGSTVYNDKYVKDFYDAMKLFVKKHYGDRSALYVSFLNAGINLRKMVAIVALSFR